LALTTGAPKFCRDRAKRDAKRHSFPVIIRYIGTVGLAAPRPLRKLREARACWTDPSRFFKLHHNENNSSSDFQMDTFYKQRSFFDSFSEF
jgi:hypothetical protein